VIRNRNTRKLFEGFTNPILIRGFPESNLYPPHRALRRFPISNLPTTDRKARDMSSVFIRHGQVPVSDSVANCLDFDVFEVFSGSAWMWCLELLSL
jgi:hypothetical protein